MSTIDTVANVVIIGSLLTFVFAGAVAAKHVDPAKKAVASNVETEGEGVSESILTHDGLRWARVRNVAMIVLGSSAISYGIFKSLSE